MSIRHFITTQDYSRPELDELLAAAARYKREKLGRELAGRAVALLFFNSSMREARFQAPSRNGPVPTGCSPIELP